MTDIPLAEIVANGDFTKTSIQPGMWVYYQYSIEEKIPEKSLSPEMRGSLSTIEERIASLESELRVSVADRAGSNFVGRSPDLIKKDMEDASAGKRILTTRKIPKEAYGLVDQVYFEDDVWQTQIRKFATSVPAERLQFIEYREIPAVEPGQVYEIRIPPIQTIAGEIAKSIPFFGKDDDAERIVQAEVVTSSTTHANALVYLQSLDKKTLFGIDASKLPARPKKTLEELNANEPVSITRTPDGIPVLTAAQQKLVRQYGGTSQTVKGTLEPGQERSPIITVEWPYKSPRQLAAKIEEIIKGQDKMVRDFATGLYSHHALMSLVLSGMDPEELAKILIKQKKRNIFIIGPTGTGKTEGARTGAEYLGVPFFEEKVKAQTPEGYKGKNSSEMFKVLAKEKDNPMLPFSVFLMDEFDKLALREQGLQEDLQDLYIPWIEGSRIVVPHESGEFEINTKYMLFIAAGAFHGTTTNPGLDEIIAYRKGIELNKYKADERRQILDELYADVTREDLLNFGFKKELLARFPIITATRHLTRDVIMEIMKHGKKSPIGGEMDLLKYSPDFGVNIDIAEKVYDIIADMSVHLGTGGRALEEAAVDLTEEIKWNIDEYRARNGGKFTITPEYALERLREKLPQGYEIKSTQEAPQVNPEGAVKAGPLKTADDAKTYQSPDEGSSSTSAPADPAPSADPPSA
jgi:ATP-dependent protease Clp ATPase subunit